MDRCRAAVPMSIRPACSGGSGRSTGVVCVGVSRALGPVRVRQRRPERGVMVGEPVLRRWQARRATRPVATAHHARTPARSPTALRALPLRPDRSPHTDFGLPCTAATAPHSRPVRRRAPSRHHMPEPPSTASTPLRASPAPTRAEASQDERPLGQRGGDRGGGRQSRGIGPRPNRLLAFGFAGDGSPLGSLGEVLPGKDFSGVRARRRRDVVCPARCAAWRA